MIFADRTVAGTLRRARRNLTGIRTGRAERLEVGSAARDSRRGSGRTTRIGGRRVVRGGGHLSRRVGKGGVMGTEGRRAIGDPPRASEGGRDWTSDWTRRKSPATTIAVRRLRAAQRHRAVAAAAAIWTTRSCISASRAKPRWRS